MANFVVTVILIVIVGSALAYLIRERKKGAKCVGCPSGGSCCSCQHAADTTSVYRKDSGASGCCGCHTDTK